MMPERIWTKRHVIDLQMLDTKLDDDTEYIRADVVRAFFEAAEFQNIDELMGKLTLETARKLGEAVSETTKRMIAGERAAIENIVLSYGREQIELYRDSRKNPDTCGNMSYYDGTSDAADVLWGRIHDRERDARREG
jgi:hypothetical protein